jgi:DNA polymerase-3 subunit epsilon
MRTILTNIKDRDYTEGGSTITQQVAKNLYFTQEKKLTRKVAEMFMAIELEKNYSKDEIFEFFRDCDVSGFNADRFDIPCIEEEFARVGMNFSASSRRHVDVQRIYHRKEPRDLSAAVRFFLGRDHAGAHGAEADTRATLEVLKAQMEKYPDLPRDVAEMDEFLVPHDPLNADRSGTLRWRDGVLCVNFGKKKGEPLTKLLVNEPNFLRWMLKGDFDVEARMIIQDLLDNGRLPPPPPAVK